MMTTMTDNSVLGTVDFLCGFFLSPLPPLSVFTPRCVVSESVSHLNNRPSLPKFLVFSPRFYYSSEGGKYCQNGVLFGLSDFLMGLGMIIGVFFLFFLFNGSVKKQKLR